MLMAAIELRETVLLLHVLFYLVFQLVHVDSKELKFAQNALFSRHPVMKTWPKDHGKGVKNS